MYLTCLLLFYKQFHSFEELIDLVVRLKTKHGFSASGSLHYITKCKYQDEKESKDSCCQRFTLQKPENSCKHDGQDGT